MHPLGSFARLLHATVAVAGVLYVFSVRFHLFYLPVVFGCCSRWLRSWLLPRSALYHYLISLCFVLRMLLPVVPCSRF
jgi:hypothetical protein